MFIESVRNNIIKHIISLRDKKNRDEQNLFIVEGNKQVCEIPQGWEIEYILCVEKYKNERFNADKIYFTTETVFNKVSGTKTPQGILAVVKKKSFKTEDVIKNKGIFIIADNLQDPGNLGNIIRTAEAYGCKGVFISKNSADAFGDKTVRSAMGAVFGVPIIQECDVAAILKSMKDKNIKTYALALTADKFLSEVKFENNAAVIVGNESNGINEDILNEVDSAVKIKMPGRTQSLNAAVACSIAVYEISKQING